MIPLTEIKRIIRRGLADSLSEIIKTVKSSPYTWFKPNRLYPKLVKSVLLAIRRNHADVIIVLADDDFYISKRLIELCLLENKPTLATLIADKFIACRLYHFCIVVLNMLSPAEKNYLIEKYADIEYKCDNNAISPRKYLHEEIKFGDVLIINSATALVSPKKHTLLLIIEYDRTNILYNFRNWLDIVDTNVIDILDAIGKCSQTESIVPMIRILMQSKLWQNISNTFTNRSVRFRMLKKLAKIYLAADGDTKITDFIRGLVCVHANFLTFLAHYFELGGIPEDNLISDITETRSNFFESDLFLRSIKNLKFTSLLQKMLDLFFSHFRLEKTIVSLTVRYSDIKILKVLLDKDLSADQILAGLYEILFRDDRVEHFKLLYKAYTSKYYLTDEVISRLYHSICEDIYDFMTERHTCVVIITILEHVIRHNKINFLKKLLAHHTCPADIKCVLGHVASVEAANIILDHLDQKGINLSGFYYDLLYLPMYGSDYKDTLENLESLVKRLDDRGCNLKSKYSNRYYDYTKCMLWLKEDHLSPMNPYKTINILYKYDQIAIDISADHFTKNRNYWRLWLKKYMVDMLIPMAELDLPAYITYLICYEYYTVCRFVPMHDLWTIITAIKHNWRKINA